MSRRILLVITLAALGCGIFAWVPAAQAGTWIQVSCVNPDGSAAPSEGWSAASTGTPEAGSSGSARCPMYGELSPIGGAAKVGDSEYVQYTPPDGSKLIGGFANMTMSADSGGSASGDAVLYEPALAYPSSVFFQCAWSLGACGPPSSPNDTTGNIYLPNDAGGDFFAQATCGGNPGTTCSQHETGATSSSFWSSVQVNFAHFTLSNSAVPAASGFSGTVLLPGLRGTGSLLFTATDTGGPGVYAVTASIDGTPVYSGTPNTNSGECVAVGSDSGALMFDYQQPCPAAEAVSIPIPTAGLPDGTHVLGVSVTDAAGNTSPVLDQTITTSNPQTTPKPRGRGLHAQFTISWRWTGATTLLRSIRVKRLPRNARVSIHCAGTRCPRLRASAKGSRKVARMLHRLGGRRLSAGQALFITVTAPHHKPERIVCRIRDGLKPSARLLR